MRSFILLFMMCLLLAVTSCKKEAINTSELSISGIGSVAFASGDAVSVYGSGFDPDPAKNTVLFNGVAGEVASASPNRLQVIAPLLTTSGKITVSTHGKSATSDQSYTIVNVLQGTYTNSFILTADKKYLLRGNVVFNSKLTIEAGTVIYGEKFTHGQLSAGDVDFEGTADKPIVFTSDQAPGSRLPGDWTGINIGISASQPTNSSIPVANGIIKYVRAEYAGYHSQGQFDGSAFTIIMTANSTYDHLQASYSSGAGITMAGYGQYVTAVNSFIHHIVAFGCMGDDFRVTGAGVTAQYGLGLKDPYYADVLKGNGIAIAVLAATDMNRFSNFTLVGYNPDARNILGIGTTVNNDAGSGFIEGELSTTGGYLTFAGGSAAIYNSVFAASWQAAVNFNNTFSWYESGDSNINTVLRNNYMVGTSPVLLPTRAGAFGNYQCPPYVYTSGSFQDLSASPMRTTFAGYNDTTKVLSFSAGKDDLGIKGLTDYTHLNNPQVLPAAGSPLLSGASFPSGSYADSPFLNKDVIYVGAFGTEDWTKPWCNFNPQNAQY